MGDAVLKFWMLSTHPPQIANVVHRHGSIELVAREIIMIIFRYYSLLEVRKEIQYNRTIVNIKMLKC